MSIHPDVTITIPGNLTSPPYLRGLRTLLDATRWSWLADEIEAQTKPPRIPEPGLWGVVEDSAGDVWICTEPHRWTRIVDGVEWPWVDLIDPVLIREGVKS